MSSIKLFEEWERQSEDYKRLGESDFSYLDRSNRPKFSDIRSTLNLWFSCLPEETKNDFKSRFMAKENFDGVFYELFLFFLFKKMCFDVKIEPDLGRPKRPDFLLTKNKDQIIVEATTNKYSFTSRIPNFKIRQQVIYELDGLCLGNFRLLIYELKLFVDKKPSINKLKEQLVNHCNQIKLNGPSYHSILDSENERFTYQDEFLYFSTALYYDEKDRTRVKKTIYGDSFDMGIDETIKEINKSVKKKISRYGNFDKPYIICVNFPNENLDQDVILSLMQPLEVHRKGIHCKWPGLSTLENLIDNSISALFISFVTPYNLADPKFWFIKNPQANFPIENEKIKVDFYEFKKDGFIFRPAKMTLSELLNLP